VVSYKKNTYSTQVEQFYLCFCFCFQTSHDNNVSWRTRQKGTSVWTQF